MNIEEAKKKYNIVIHHGLAQIIKGINEAIENMESEMVWAQELCYNEWSALESLGYKVKSGKHFLTEATYYEISGWAE